MNAKQQHEQEPSRAIRVAAALDTRYSNPLVAALNRQREAKSDKWRAFWRNVASALQRPYHCQSWMQDEMDAWARIRACQARAALAGGKS